MSEAVAWIYRAGVDIQWGEFHRDFDESHHVVPLPSYQWDYKNHWIQYRGDWNLTKGRIDADTKSLVAVKRFSTSSIHQIVSEQYDASMGCITAETSITDPSLQGVVDGHAMNGHGVASSVRSIEQT